MIWLETKTSEEVAKRSDVLSGRLAGGDGLYEGDLFWADAIKAVRDDPQKRLELARRHLPLPAAFSEAAVAIRAIIRTRRKAKEPIEAELGQLHHLGAVASLGIYHELDEIPYAVIAALDLSPGLVGWDELVLLNASDRKWMAEAWGSPLTHTTARKLYPHVCAGKTRPDWANPDDQAVRPVRQTEKTSGPPPAPIGRTYTLGLVGESFDNRQSEIRKCRVGEVVTLLRDPANRHDPNAIRCVGPRGNDLGMISKENASWLAGKIDRGDQIEAVIREICSQPGKPHVGVVIDCHLNGGEGPRDHEPRARGWLARLLGL